MRDNRLCGSNCICGAGRTRTADLSLMRAMSYHCSTAPCLKTNRADKCTLASIGSVALWLTIFFTYQGLFSLSRYIVPCDIAYRIDISHPLHGHLHIFRGLSRNKDREYYLSYNLLLRANIISFSRLCKKNYKITLDFYYLCTKIRAAEPLDPIGTGGFRGFKHLWRSDYSTNQ